MSNLLKLVDSLEIKVKKTVNELQENKLENVFLNEELAKKNQVIINKDAEIEEWKDKYEALKLTNSMLGSEDYKKETKIKINALIREVDHCIAQLSK